MSKEKEHTVEPGADSAVVVVVHKSAAGTGRFAGALLTAVM